jgi:hypothetical protein
MLRYLGVMTVMRASETVVTLEKKNVDKETQVLALKSVQALTISYD